MEDFIKEALGEYAECHDVQVVAGLDGLAVLATVELDGQVKRFRIKAEEE